jgi:hypothetical protein
VAELLDSLHNTLIETLRIGSGIAIKLKGLEITLNGHDHLNDPLLDIRVNLLGVFNDELAPADL